jgi:type IV pilus assembly protein PilA
MVVVAIIGILATVAIPRVNKFIAKARTSEAQVNLSSIYTNNKNFYVEFAGYTTSFTAMGFAPEGKLRYVVGWTQGGACNNSFNTQKPGICNGTSQTIQVCGNGVVANGCMTVAGAGNAYPTAGFLPATAIDAAAFSTFTAGAGALLISGNANDQWTITQDKLLSNPSDGTL